MATAWILCGLNTFAYGTMYILKEVPSVYKVTHASPDPISHMYILKKVPSVYPVAHASPDPISHSTVCKNKRKKCDILTCEN